MNTEFNSISIKIASPEQIKDLVKRTSCRRRNSSDAAEGPFLCPEKGRCNCGEVRKAETINYRSFRPEPEGLFCEAIFGPQKDWECNCGKYKRIKHKGVICDRCGVEITQQSARRERLGYIQLAAPVSHIWYFKGIPSRIGTFCGLSSRDIERVLYFEAFIVVEVTDPDCPLEPRQLLTEIEYVEYSTSDKYKNGFRAGTGAEVIREILSSIDLEEEKKCLAQMLEETTSQQKKLKIAKQLKQIAEFAAAGQRPEWMILDVIPVIPPELRPLVPLEGGRFATSDLNDLYRRIINRNNRLRKLIQLRSPEVILRNEKRMLQEAVDAFFDNGRHGKRVTGPGNRPLKSLADVLKGKIGRFRQNLLGKRVDYSGRSVIVVGPELGLHQCGLPKQMAVDLFKPFIIERLQAHNHAQTIKRAKHIAENTRADSPVWEVVEEVIADHPVLLNRPPTLHRLGIQAFLPVLVEGKSIRIPPLVCKAFNADFDGDQMAVHVPLTVEAQAEAKMLMLSSHNILKPSHGDPIAVPELDMVLGPSFLTKTLPEHTQDAKDLHAAYAAKDSSAFKALRDKPWYHRRYAHSEEVIAAHVAGQLKLHDSLQLFCEKTAGGKTTEPILTTVGRVIFNEVLPRELDWADQASEQNIRFFNAEAGGRELSALIDRCFNHPELGTRATTEVLEKIQTLAFEYATLSGISPGILDYLTPEKRNVLVKKAQAEIDALLEGASATELEEYENEQIRIWIDAMNNIEDEMFDTLPRLETALVERGDARKVHPYVDSSGSEIADQAVEGFSPVHIMADSGARARKNPFMQISAFIGLKAKQDGNILIPPIGTSTHRQDDQLPNYFCSYREGLDVIDYFNSTYGSRKGLVDTAMKTAASGYLTRKLVDVAQDVRVTTEDCGTLNSIQKFSTAGGDLAFKISGRVAGENIIHPKTVDVLIPANGVISKQVAEHIGELDIKVVKVRSVLTCEAEEGVCAKCYGNDLTTNHLVNVGEAVGIIAAQSIGEPGTQLTMRTFHTGGAVEDVTEARQRKIFSKADGTVRFLDFQDGRTVQKEGERWIVIKDSRNFDGPAYKVLQINHPDCPLRDGELLSEKQYIENMERYKGFDTKAWQYEVTAVLDSNCDLKVGDRLSQAEYAKKQKEYDFERFVTKKLRVKEVHHPDVSVKPGDFITEAEDKALRAEIRDGFNGEWHYLDSETDARLAPEDMTEGGVVDISLSSEERDANFKRIYRITEKTSKTFPFKVGDEVPTEEITPWLTPFEVDSKPVYIMNTEIPDVPALLKQTTSLDEGGPSDAPPFTVAQELTEREYMEARARYKQLEHAFKVERQETERYTVTDVYHPECDFEVGDELKKAEVERAHRRYPGFNAPPLRHRVTQIYHPDCPLKKGDLLTESEKKELAIKYPAVAVDKKESEIPSDAIEAERIYRVTALHHDDCPLKKGAQLTSKEVSAYRRRYKGFDAEAYFEVTKIEGETTALEVGQRLTETQHKELLKPDTPRNAIKTERIYRVTALNREDCPLKKGAQLTSKEVSAYRRRYKGFDAEAYFEVTKIEGETTALEVGQRLTETQHKELLKLDTPPTVELTKRGYKVRAVHHADLKKELEGRDELTEDEYKAYNRKFKGFNVVIDKYRILEDNRAIEEPLEAGVELSAKEYRKLKKAPLKSDPPITVKLVTKIEGETTASGVSQWLTEAQHEELLKSDTPITVELTKRGYKVRAVHHADLKKELEGRDELTEDEYKAYNRKFKGFNAVIDKYRILEDNRAIEEPLEAGVELSSEEYRELKKESQQPTYTLTQIHHACVMPIETTNPKKDHELERVHFVPRGKRNVDERQSPADMPSEQQVLDSTDTFYSEGDVLPTVAADSILKKGRCPGFEVDELALRMRIEIETADGTRVPHVIPPRYSFDLKEGDKLRAGETLAERHDRTANSDIVAGIPRVTDLFEARRPKSDDAAEIAEIEGYLRFAGAKNGVPAYRIEHEGHQSPLYPIPDEKRRDDVAEGSWVEAGAPLTDGFLNPHDILRIGRTKIDGVSVEGTEAVWAYLVDEVQKVYGAGTINDKHIETIVLQMLTKVRIVDPGDTHFYPNDEVHHKAFERVNNEVEERGDIPATGVPILQSISKASLSTDSFISAASFQQTTKVLTDAAVSGQRDRLYGLKENVILGRLIPVGSGFSDFRNLAVSHQEQPEGMSEDEDQVNAKKSPRKGRAKTSEQSEQQGVYLEDGDSSISPTDVGDTVVGLDDE